MIQMECNLVAACTPRLIRPRSLFNQSTRSEFPAAPRRPIVPSAAQWNRNIKLRSKPSNTNAITNMTLRKNAITLKADRELALCAKTALYHVKVASVE